MTCKEKIAAWYARMAMRYAALSLRYNGEKMYADKMDELAEEMKKEVK